MRVTVNHPSWNIGFYWKMTRRCVAAGCSNSHKDGYSLYTFPKDLKIRRHWVKFVRMRRAKWPGPSKYSYLCSAHFGPESFSHPPYHRYRSFQINFRNDLKPDAIPTRYSADATDDPVKVDPSSPVFSITILCPIISWHSHFPGKYRTNHNFPLNVSPLHAPAIYDPKIIVISSLVC